MGTKILFLYEGKNREGYTEQRHEVFENIQEVAADRPTVPGEFFHLEEVDVSFFRMLDAAEAAQEIANNRAQIDDIDLKIQALQVAKRDLVSTVDAQAVKLEEELKDG